MLSSDALEPYVKGLEVWVPHAEEGWQLATIQSRELTEAHITLETRAVTGDERTNPRMHMHAVPASPRFLGQDAQNTELPPLRNPKVLDGADDLTSLSYLHEPAVLNNVRIRYAAHNIYTYSGIVLIAMNPFQRVQLYAPELMTAYSGKRRGELEPHLFAIAEEAFRDMIQEQRDETIVVSGESGAGKTVSAKYIMRYFATVATQSGGKSLVADASKRDDRGTEIEEKIMATNPILESFGNAKTTRNDNSSRFGKYIQIHFDKQSYIVGATIRTYLLERSRLIYQPNTERNYHIFYQLCAGAPPSERAQLCLDECTKFAYLNQGNCSEIQGVNDFEEFAETQKALSTIGMSVQRQWDIFRVLASLLHLGNVAIAAQSRTNASIAEDEEAFVTATRLLGVDAAMLAKWITNKQIITRSDKIITKLTPAQAVSVRDSVAKFIYASLFDWLVTNVNATLCNEESASQSHSFIGVLDIYGFEHFKRNSFEQFCINYANEKLQQEFNQHVFKLEQEEYIREQIDWQFIEFTDNQPCIALIEGKLGVLALLDEESRMPSGTDENFVNKLYQQLDTPANKKYFKKPRFGQSAFTICHYAHDVTYEAEGFLDKNRDNVPDEIMEVLEASTFDFLLEVQKHRQAVSVAINYGAAIMNEAKEVASPQTKGRGNAGVSKKPTLGSVFKGSLIELMTTINSTEVHYIRCIKPNEAKVAWKFEPQMTLSQLRACGVLETIHISSRGYPTRRTLAEFISRYYMLVPSSKRPESPRDYCAAILDHALKSPDKYQIGLTKVFFRAGQIALLEKARTDKLVHAVTMIKKNFLARIYRRKYLALRHATITVQVKYRRILRLREKERIRREAAATTIQRHWRGYNQRQCYRAALCSIIYMQTGK
ncbi:P-loop containing nucleoside triphosphate hydrolase protein [Syncephalis pseudoplumigaleata]|uniref:P-loop containing nucleoside triphosphate hydrolase protein n=1 Tax=Syncephalis pseudoplumigaleata TaxID=1712513 RepID=A0A4P9Z132_9FUNG|nr:P-loop containing nucleoside triphosphate hydrolase protein [Syncephalis pseudoplumigaleata]|eukprot:RKP25431.1 P-loop containing nucleoside triphosphate hydrolase protein [Syncephalis pseudoplumigaleata]